MITGEGVWMEETIWMSEFSQELLGRRGCRAGGREEAEVDGQSGLADVNYSI